MRTAYSPRTRHQLTTNEPAVTVQYFKEQCDVTNILAKYKANGTLFATATRPQYGDFTNIHTYQEAQNALIQAHESFSALPSEIRRQFGNDPQEFVEFCENSDNLEKLRQMGLAPESKEIPPEILANATTEPSE